MILKHWAVILGLGIIGLALGAYWLSLPSVPEGVTPQSGEGSTINGLAALAGAITTLGTAVFGVLGKYNDFRAKRLAIAKAELDLEQQRREMEASK